MKSLFSPLRTRAFFVVLVALLAGPVMAHEPMDWNGDIIHVLLDKEGTGGDMGMFTVETSGPGGPARHVHDDAGEAFYLITGQAEVLVGTELLIVEEGQSVYVPKGMEHSFRLLSEDGGKILVIVTPGGFEGFFEATKHLSIPADMEEIERISVEEFKQRFTGPPLGNE